MKALKNSFRFASSQNSAAEELPGTPHPSGEWISPTAVDWGKVHGPLASDFLNASQKCIEPKACRCKRYILRNAKLAGNAYGISSIDNLIINDLVHDPRRWRKSIPPKQFNSTRHIQGEALLLAGDRCRNYYHWLVETLPKVRFFQNEKLWRKLPVIVPALSPFQIATLDSLGLPRELRLEFNNHLDQWTIDALHYATPHHAERRIDASDVEWLRKRFLSKQPLADANKKIYVSRASSKSRGVQNERELESELKANGFDIVRGEELTFNEQVKIFSTAEVIVGPHGAGLTNMIFAPHGARILELHSPSYINPCFACLASACGHSYECLICNETSDGSKIIEMKLAKLITNPDH